MAPGPLDGVRVLNLASVGPAARASRWLADYGAAVVSVGPVSAAGAAQVAPPYHAYGADRDVRRILLDLKDPDGTATFLRLAERADVVIESFRPGVVDRLGIGYANVREVNPAIVYCSTSGFGQAGPQHAWAGHDVNYLAMGGFLACSARDERGGPALPGTTVADAAAGGMHAVMAIQAALIRRHATGVGAYLDVSVVDGVLALMSMQIDAFLATGEAVEPGRGILLGQYACYGTYRARDDRWLSVAAIEPKFWANLCRELGLERWVESQLDDDAQRAIRGDLASAFATRDRDEWVARLSGRDTCAAPVLSVAEVAAGEYVAQRGLVREVEHPAHGRFRQLAPTLAGAAVPASRVRLPDRGVTDTDALLNEAGMDPADITRLREKGVVA